MTAIQLNRTPLTAGDPLAIPAVRHAEATRLAEVEFGRLLAVVEALSGDDWSQPTYCTQWRVREMVAHLAGACAGESNWAEFRRQMIQNPYTKTEAMMVDGINRRQVEDRADWSTEQLLDELRSAGPKAIRVRHRLPWLLRKLIVPFGPPLGTTTIDYLTDIIYTRDWWMHRYDLCAATGQTMVLTDDHDGRIIALVVRDLARKLRRQWAGRTVDLLLTGPGGGVYRFGAGDAAQATVALDLPTFGLLTSERITPAQAAARAVIDGDRAAADWLLTNAAVPY